MTDVVEYAPQSFSKIQICPSHSFRQQHLPVAFTHSFGCAGTLSLFQSCVNIAGLDSIVNKHTARSILLSGFGQSRDVKRSCQTDLMRLPVSASELQLKSGALAHSGGCLLLGKYSLCLNLKSPTCSVHRGCSGVIRCTSKYTSLDP